MERTCSQAVTSTQRYQNAKKNTYPTLFIMHFKMHLKPNAPPLHTRPNSSNEKHNTSDKDVGQLERKYTAGGSINWYTQFETWQDFIKLNVCKPSDKTS